MTTIIDVRHLKKAFQQSNALADVTFSIQKGEIFGFLGPSGSGKTTTIKILTAQLHKDAGEAFVFDMPVSAMQDSKNREKFGILTDNSGLYSRLSIEENLALYCKLYNVPNTAIKEALEFVNLYGERKKKVSMLSKGMTQRVLLARAILHKPDLLFLDEPTSALDPVNTAHIYKGLRALNELGTTIFLTTHDMQEADTLCHRVAFLNKGTIQAIGTPKQLKEQYSEQTITVELKDGSSQVIKNDAQNAQSLHDWMANNQISRIFSNEPTLGDIFMKITGSDLQ
ncbi:ABC transporter ATP-binding protein [Bacillus ndiopicus]|uniref:ABC transporter ATP-binding protein n=1 Tax=Bacillus ndiopicus TaxID=1347368 RepID=UPI0005A990C7|nr:ABC transporter ATP-binding protein [Bacillus ndiopicus]